MQQEVVHAHGEHVAHEDDLLEAAVDAVEGGLPLGDLLGRGHLVGGLEVDAVAPEVCHEVGLELLADALALDGRAPPHHAHVDGVAAHAQHVVDGALYGAAHLDLVESEVSVAQLDALEVVLFGIADEARLLMSKRLVFSPNAGSPGFVLRHGRVPRGVSYKACAFRSERLVKNMLY